ncbi:MAG: hypothetical protein FJZ01_05260 [Candidatus Sericytochromatia bacterium]|nr:hypothetical protein [Candidatus Tanganyikabacteria bacterium]
MPAPPRRRKPEPADRESRTLESRPDREAAAPRSVRRFRFSLRNVRHASASALPGWLASQTGLPPSAFGNIRIVGDYALVEVDSRHGDRFRKEWAARNRA